MRPTPETDAAEFYYDGKTGFVEIDFCRKMERERDEARWELSQIYHWVERRSQDGFIDSQSHEQNITRCYDALYDRLDAAERERDEAREEAQKMSESNQVLLAEVRFYRNQLKEDAK